MEMKSYIQRAFLEHPSCIKFTNLTYTSQYPTPTMETLPYSHMTINSEQELPPFRTCQYGPSKLNYTSNCPQATNLR